MPKKTTNRQIAQNIHNKAYTEKRVMEERKIHDIRHGEKRTFELAALSIHCPGAAIGPYL
jgi:hypothetical protein